MTVVTLVHGTFGRRSAWTREDSHFCRTFRRQHTGDVVFEDFKWSGWNSPRTRLIAAANLRERLLDEFVRYPSATHVLVAHSHGGNICLMALSDSEIRSRVERLVCLATPFALHEPRKYQRAIKLTAILVAAGVAGFPLAFVVSLATRYLHQVGWNLLPTIVIIGRLLYIVPGMLVFEMCREFLSWFAERQTRRAELLTPTSCLEGVRMLSVAAPRDEAQYLLRWLGILADIPMKLWLTLAAVTFGYSVVALVVNGAAAVQQALDEEWKFTMFFGASPPPNVLESLSLSTWLLTILLALLPACFLTALQMITYQFAVGLYAACLRGSPAGYGWSGVFTQWFARIVVVDEPPDLLHADFYRCSIDDCKKDLGRTALTWSLRHTLPYRHDDTVRKVAAWCAGTWTPPVAPARQSVLGLSGGRET